jgi:hypothetical protein
MEKLKMENAFVKNVVAKKVAQQYAAICRGSAAICRGSSAAV